MDVMKWANGKYRFRLKEIREDAEMTGQQIADLLGKNRSAISHLESGAVFPRAYDLLKLSEYFNLPIDEFFEEK